MDGSGDTIAWPTLNAPRLALQKHFQSRHGFTTAVKKKPSDDGWGSEVGRGGGCQASVRCSGRTHHPVTKIHGGCGFCYTACKQTRGRNDEWKVTSIVAEHVNCSLKGPPRGSSVADLRPAADAIVKANQKITVDALKTSIQFQTDVNVHPRTANRLTRADLDVSADTRAQGFLRLGSYLDKLVELSNRTVTDVKVFSTGCCHLKRHWNEVTCLLNVKDFNIKIVIVANRIAHVENADTYKYMFSNVKKNEKMAA